MYNFLEEFLLESSTPEEAVESLYRLIISPTASPNERETARARFEGFCKRKGVDPNKVQEIKKKVDSEPKRKYNNDEEIKREKEKYTKSSNTEEEVKKEAKKDAETGSKPDPEKAKNTADNAKQQAEDVKNHAKNAAETGSKPDPTTATSNAKTDNIASNAVKNSNLKKKGIGFAAGAAVGITSAVKFKKFKKNAKNLYVTYKNSGGKLSYDQWYKQNSRKYKIGMIGGGLTAAASSLSFAKKKNKSVNEDYCIGLYESLEDYYDNYEDEFLENLYMETYMETLYGTNIYEEEYLENLYMETYMETLYEIENYGYLTESCEELELYDEIYEEEYLNKIYMETYMETLYNL